MDTTLLRRRQTVSCVFSNQRIQYTVFIENRGGGGAGLPELSEYGAHDTSNSTADGLSNDKRPSHGYTLCGRECTTCGNASDPRLNPSRERA